MRKISVHEITNTVKEMCIEANYNLSKDMQNIMNKSLENEISPVGS